MRDFFREVAPGHDEEKVYASDMKKIVSWYHIIKDMPLFSEPDPSEAAASVTEPVAEVEEAKPSKKAKAPVKAKAEVTEEATAPKLAKAKKK